MYDGRRHWLGQTNLTPAARRSRMGSASVISDATWSQVLAAPLAVVDFWSPTCPYCVAYKPVFEDVATQVPSGILMATVNVNEGPQAAGSFGIQSIPATIFLQNGKEIHRVEGQLSKQDLLAEIAKVQTPGAALSPAGAPSGIPTWTVVTAGLAAAGVAAYFAFWR